MDIGSILLSMVVVVAAVGAIVWTIGFSRAVRQQAILDRLRPYSRLLDTAAPEHDRQQPIINRLHMYCQRGG